MSTLLNIVSVNDHIPQVVVCLVLIDYYLEFDVAVMRKPLCEVQFLLFAFLDLEKIRERDVGWNQNLFFSFELGGLGGRRGWNQNLFFSFEVGGLGGRREWMGGQRDEKRHATCTNA